VGQKLAFLPPHVQNVLASQQVTVADLSRSERSAMAERAYQQWLKKKKVEGLQKYKERKYEQDWEVLQEMQRQTERKQAQVSYSTWKRNKDLEKNLNTREYSRRNVALKETPLLPGYCSVWSCDEELASHMLAHVQREMS
jgi:hypothetical protein